MQQGVAERPLLELLELNGMAWGREQLGLELGIRLGLGGFRL